MMTTVEAQRERDRQAHEVATLMDQEQFETWKESPATRWVMARLALLADRVENSAKERLFLAGGLSVADWQALQAPAAWDRGYVRALRLVVDLDMEQVSDE